MAEIGAIAEAFSKYGAWAIVALLLVVVRALYNRCVALQDAHTARLEQWLRESINAQSAAAHALDKLEEVIRGLAR